MKPGEVRFGLPVVVAWPAGGGPPTSHRRGRIIGGPSDVRYGPGCYVWSVSFGPGSISLLKASEMEPADVVTQLGVLLSEGGVEQEQEGATCDGPDS